MQQTTMRKNIMKVVMAGLLCAVGILIPMVSPLKVVIPPASFTVASHVAVFIAMFISPAVGISVALGTTIGFLIGGFPIEIVLRALTHVVFTAVGAFWIKAKPDMLKGLCKSTFLSAVLAVLHGVLEVLVVLPFYIADPGKYGSFFMAIFLLVGIGSVIHSMVDFAIAYVIWQPLKKSFAVTQVK
ncbi:MAG: hypothetical protein IKM60_02255 [Clostridia bacterium]|nr:hypothetical protein [Clostridia bacterium]